jgi:uncharacterized protein (DUF1015 family)
MPPKITPFAALLPKADLVQQIVCPPYDVIETDEAREFAAGNPYSLLHITRAEIDLDDRVDQHSEVVYRKAAENLQLFQDKGWLKRDKPAIYVYQTEEVRDGKRQRQTGIVGGVSGEDYDKGLIKKHEKTRIVKEDDRTHLADILDGHSEPVFLVHRAHDGIRQCLLKETEAPPLFEVVDEKQVTHRFWRSQDQNNLLSCIAELDALYIADGHHRSAAGARIKELKQSRNAGHTGNEAYNYFPAVIFPHDEVAVYEYNWDGPAESRPLAKHQMIDIMKISDEGGIMPPKSTWFAPKLISGLFVYKF